MLTSAALTLPYKSAHYGQLWQGGVDVAASAAAALAAAAQLLNNSAYLDRAIEMYQ